MRYVLKKIYEKRYQKNMFNTPSFFYIHNYFSELIFLIFYEVFSYIVAFCP